MGMIASGQKVSKGDIDAVLSAAGNLLGLQLQWPGDGKRTAWNDVMRRISDKVDEKEQQREGVIRGGYRAAIRCGLMKNRYGYILTGMSANNGRCFRYLADNIACYSTVLNAQAESVSFISAPQVFSLNAGIYVFRCEITGKHEQLSFELPLSITPIVFGTYEIRPLNGAEYVDGKIKKTFTPQFIGGEINDSVDFEIQISYAACHIWKRGLPWNIILQDTRTARAFCKSCIQM